MHRNLVSIYRQECRRGTSIKRDEEEEYLSDVGNSDVEDDDERSPPPTPDAPPYSPITSPEGSDRARSRSPIWHQPSESAPRVIAIFSEDGTPFEAEHFEEREEDTTFLATDAHTIFVSPNL
ncbi:unnamed protein product [Colias eurytheme]|nr:unnamed protein product [Colias eurytheme]